MFIYRLHIFWTGRIYHIACVELFWGRNLETTGNENQLNNLLVSISLTLIVKNKLYSWNPVDCTLSNYCNEETELFRDVFRWKISIKHDIFEIGATSKQNLISTEKSKNRWNTLFSSSNHCLQIPLNKEISGIRL